jgi:putative phosphoesterase
MKVLIVSDTHRRHDNFFEVLKRVGPIDMLIHCGDAEGSEYTISEAAGCETEIVLGNNDFFSSLPREREFSIGKYKVWLVHGHNYYVYMSNEHLKQEAICKGVDIVMYGHTHKPVIDIEDSIIAINPGSLTYPRQENKRPSFILMEVDRLGEVHFTLNYL